MAKQLFTTHVTIEDKEFNRTFNEYRKWVKKQPKEIVSAKGYFIAANAMNTTKTANKETIRSKLIASATKYSDVPLAAILVNKQLGAKGKKGLTGEKMKQAVEKFISKQQSKIQFLRSGWIPALKQLDYWNKQGDTSFSKRFAPKKPNGVKQYGKNKGEAILRQGEGKASCTISNFVGKGRQDSKTVQPLLIQGLMEAVKRETASMQAYIMRKMQEQHDKMKRTNKV